MRLLFLGLACFLTASPALADEQIWAVMQLKAKINDRFSVGLEWQPRLTNGLSRNGDNLFGPSLSYKLNDRATITGMYTAAITTPLNRPIRREHRFTAQLQLLLAGKKGKAALTSRTRLEQRIVENNDDPAMRFRQQLRAELWLSDSRTVFASSEAFFGLESADWGLSAGLDQVRTMVGVNQDITDHLGIELAFQDQRFSRPRPQSPNQVGIITLTYRLN